MREIVRREYSSLELDISIRVALSLYGFACRERLYLDMSCACCRPQAWGACVCCEAFGSIVSFSPTWRVCAQCSLRMLSMPTSGQRVEIGVQL